MDHEINADYSRFARADAGEMEWVESPAPGVWRKRFDYSGPAEWGRATSLVRYDPGARFPAHDHPEGEEILVLEGVLSDHQGDHGAGTYLLNPEGFRHEPWSEPGCLLFVKLRQYAGQGRPQVALDTGAMDWEDTEIAGLKQKILSDDEGFEDRSGLYLLKYGLDGPWHEHPGGEEAYIIEGEIEDEFGRYGPGCWARFPRGSSHSVKVLSDCILYAKTGGLPPEA